MGGDRFYTHLYHFFDSFQEMVNQKIYVLLYYLYIFLEDLYLESQGCQQLQSVDINYQSFT